MAYLHWLLRRSFTNRKLRVLILVDSFSDADLVESELQGASIEYTAKRVMTEQDYLRELKNFVPDLIVSDYHLLNFNGALALAEAIRKRARVPFILVADAVDETLAKAVLTNGARDYVIKSHLERLVPAVKKAIAED